MADIVTAAMAAGALGLSSSHAPTHLDMADRPVPSRLATHDELRALADAQGRFGRGSIAYAPQSAVEGIDAADRDLLIELAGRAGVPLITQGLGGRSKVDAPDPGVGRVPPVPRSLGRRGLARLLAAHDPTAERPVHRRSAAPRATRACPSGTS